MAITGTYRLQLHAGFGFTAARRIVDYLDDLGVSHAYVSPYLAAAPGSRHGYDLVDPRALSVEIGTEDDYVAWTSSLEARGMGHVVDFVPNHMAASNHNAWWTDVLENGAASLYADYFDIEWHPPTAALDGKVLLPVLGAQYGEALERGEISLERRGGAFFVRYFESEFPASPPSVAPLLERAARSLDVGRDDPRRQELESIVTALQHLPASSETARERRLERAREKEISKRRLAFVCEEPSIGAAVDAAVARMNGRAGDASSFDDLDALLLAQCYRLAFWRVATEEINYRRFFDVNGLAAIRMERDAVFENTHARLREYIDKGRVQGVRLDHTDGLVDPMGYFDKLRHAIARRDVWVVAEKILAPGEELPRGWPIDGTTGYDFLAASLGLFVDPDAEPAMTQVYRDATGDTRTFSDHELEAKRAIMRSSLSSDVHILAVRLERVAIRDRRSRDLTYAMLRRVVSETIAAFPVYRTYVRPTGAPEPDDVRVVSQAIRLASLRNPDISPSAFELLRDVLLLTRVPSDDEDRARRVDVAMRFQQLTGPVAAKGDEDTAFYTYVRFVALNEVGSRPDVFGTTLESFHAGNAARAAHWPRTMTASTTHDTKRGEDVRARLAVLSEMPERWAAWVGAWAQIAAAHVVVADDAQSPSAHDRYLFFQTMVGAYPLVGGADGDLVRRVANYCVKAARESRQRTSWLSPDDAYEARLRQFVDTMLADARFSSSLAECARVVAPLGASNGLALVAVKMASPGIPDTFQGSELWDLRLVDPDNRGDVDFDRRRSLLRSIEGARAKDLLASFEDGRIKLHVVRAALRLRRDRPALFAEGGYLPLDAGESVVAFARPHASGVVVCAATRRPFTVTAGRHRFAVGDAWGDAVVAVPRGAYRDVLTGRMHDARGESLAAADVFRDLPVALLATR